MKVVDISEATIEQATGEYRLVAMENGGVRLQRKFIKTGPDGWSGQPWTRTDWKYVDTIPERDAWMD